MVFDPAASGLLWPMSRVVKAAALAAEQPQPSSSSAVAAAAVGLGGYSYALPGGGATPSSSSLGGPASGATVSGFGKSVASAGCSL